jgi:uncharacterized protein YjbI with pentapeptide repeats
MYTTSTQGGDYNITIIANDTAGNINDSETTTFTVNAVTQRIFNSWINGTYYPANYSWEAPSVITNSDINDSTIFSENSAEFSSEVYISGSTIINSTIKDLTGDGYAGADVYIVNCVIINSIKVDAYCENSHIENSIDPRSNTTGSDINNSDYYNSNITYSNVNYSSVNDSSVNGSVLEGSTLINSIVSENSAIIDSTLNGTIVVNSTITEGSNLTNTTATNSIVENTSISDSVFTDCNITNGSVTNLTENATFTFNGTTVPVNGTYGIEYYVNFGPSVIWTGMPEWAYVGDTVPVSVTASDLNIVNGTSIMFAFPNEGLTYTYIVTDIADNDVFNVPSTLVINDVGNYSVHLRVTDSFGLYAETSPAYLRIEPRPVQSSGGGGGGGKCKTQWICTNWSVCVNGTMTRNCTKQAVDCVVDSAMPNITASCTPDKIINATNKTSEGNETNAGKGIGARITGAVIGASDMAKGAMIFVIVMIAAAVLMWLIRKTPAVLKKRNSARKR